MHFTIKNAIDWNRNAVRRATSRLQRARTEAEKATATADIHRYEDNIEFLKGQAR